MDWTSERIISPESVDVHVRTGDRHRTSSRNRPHSTTGSQIRRSHYHRNHFAGKCPDAQYTAYEEVSQSVGRVDGIAEEGSLPLYRIDSIIAIPIPLFLPPLSSPLSRRSSSSRSYQVPRQAAAGPPTPGLWRRLGGGSAVLLEREESWQKQEADQGSDNEPLLNRGGS